MITAAFKGITLYQKGAESLACLPSAPLPSLSTSAELELATETGLPTISNLGPCKCRSLAQIIHHNMLLYPPR